MITAKLIRLIHIVGIFLIWFSGFTLPSKCVPMAFFIQLATMVSWVMFDGCILWTWEKKHNPDLKIKRGSMTRSLLGDVKKITDTVIYLNFMVLSYRMENPILGLLFSFFYIAMNGKVEFRGDDNLEKYN